MSGHAVAASGQRRTGSDAPTGRLRYFERGFRVDWPRFGLAGDQVDHGGEVAVRAVPASATLRGLDEGAQAFQEAVRDEAVVPAHGPESVREQLLVVL